MNKRILIPALVVVLIIIIWGIYRISSNNPISSPALNAVPEDAFMILKSDNILSLAQNISKENKIWQNISVIPQISNINKEIEQFDSIVTSHSEFEDLLESRQIILSFHMLSKVKAGVLIIVGLKNRSERKDIESLMKEQVNDRFYIQKRNYDDATVYDVREKKEPTNSISFSFHKGILLLSKSPILIEKGVRQLNIENGLTQRPGFKHTLNVAGKNVKGNLFIRLSEFPQFLTAFAPLAEKSFGKIARIGGWVELDLSALHDKEWLMSGFIQSADTMGHMFAMLKNQNPVKPEVIKILPKNTFFFEFLGLSDVYQFRRDVNSYLRKQDKFDLYSHQRKDIKEKYKFDYEMDFEQNLEDQFLVAFSGDMASSAKINKYFLAKLRNRKFMTELLDRLVLISAEKDSVNPKQYKEIYKINKSTNYTIWHFPVNNLTQRLYDLYLPHIKTSYCAFVDDYIVMTKSKESLKALINSYVQNQTFETNPEFKNFIESLSSRSNLLVYNEINQGGKYWRKYLSNTMVRISERYKMQLNRFQALAIQISNSSDLLLSNVFLKLNPNSNFKPNIVWATHLENKAVLKPQIVVNHYSHNKEVFVQDAKNKIYLIDQYGKILWSKKLSERIINEVVQVDYYKNGKLQYLFNTENYIHLLDRNGKYVEAYPVKLKAPATNGLSVFDYNKKKKYRIFVATKNKQIYAYNIEGKIVSGWEFNLTDNYVRRPIQHILDQGKDYIVFSDDLKTYITDRRGKIRVKPKANFPVSINNRYFLDKATEKHGSRILTTSISGIIMFIYLKDGKVTKLDTKNFTPNHYFDFTDVTGDKIKNFVYADENKLNVYSLNMKNLYTIKLENNIDFPPHLYAFSKEDRRIGLTDSKSNKIYLLRGKTGTVLKGFPQEGTTEFSITKLNKNQSKFNLIVGNKNNFLYNYILSK